MVQKMTRVLTCVEWVRKTTKSIRVLPFIGNAQKWIDSDLLVRIEPNEIKDHKEVICILPDVGQYGHMVKIHKCDNNIISGEQCIGPYITKFRQVYSPDRHYILVAKDNVKPKKSSKKSVQVDDKSPDPVDIDVKNTTKKGNKSKSVPYPADSKKSTIPTGVDIDTKKIGKGTNQVKKVKKEEGKKR